MVSKDLKIISDSKSLKVAPYCAFSGGSTDFVKLEEISFCQVAVLIGIVLLIYFVHSGFRKSGNLANASLLVFLALRF